MTRSKNHWRKKILEQNLEFHQNKEIPKKWYIYLLLFIFTLNDKDDDNNNTKSNSCLFQCFGRRKKPTIKKKIYILWIIELSWNITYSRARHTRSQTKKNISVEAKQGSLVVKRYNSLLFLWLLNPKYKFTDVT